MHPLRLILISCILASGCKSTSYFNTSNDVTNQQAVLYLKDSDPVPGLITVSLETVFHANLHYKPSIEFVPDGKNERQHISLDGVIGYKMGDAFYALKRVDIFMNGTDRLLFLKRLTPDNSRIHLYELITSHVGSDTGESLYSYYLSLQGAGLLETINICDSRILPLFDVKMSEIVSDCPALADKIRKKESGYFIPFVSFDLKKHPDVLLRIINEYNSCN